MLTSDVISIVAMAVVMGFLLGFFYVSPKTEYVRVEVPLKVLVGPWRIGDTVRYTSGGPVFHVNAVGDDGRLELFRWVKEACEEIWEDVHPGELVAAKPVDSEPKAATSSL